MALPGGSLRCNKWSGIGNAADPRRPLAEPPPLTQLRHWPPNFAATHSSPSCGPYGIFVQEGAKLTLGDNFPVAGGVSGLVAAGIVNGGQGAQDGQAFATGIYLQGNNPKALTFSPDKGETLTVAGVIGDDKGSATAAGYTAAPGTEGTAGITLNGPGTVMLTAANTYTGGTTIKAGTLEVGNGGSIKGNVQFAGANATLQFLAVTVSISSTA